MKAYKETVKTAQSIKNSTIKTIKNKTKKI